MTTLHYFNDSKLLLINPTTTLEVLGLNRKLCLRKVYHEPTRLEISVDNKIFTFSHRPRLEVVAKIMNVKFNRQHKRELRKFLTLC
jgi:hypothetical protein